jgi:hypothetical protein
MKLQNKSDLITYVQQRLGAPVINIDMAPTQFEQNVDDALQFFTENHYDGMHNTYYEIITTAQDVVDDYITIPDNIIAIIDIIEPSSTTGKDVWMSNAWQLQSQTYNNMRSGTSINMSNYVMTQQQISMANKFFSPVRDFTFNKSSNKLRIEGAALEEGNSFAVHCYTMLDPDVDLDVWNDAWLKSYATALCGIQWGNNLQKHDGAVLPGGLTLNASGILDEYTELKEKLLEEFHTTYSDPIMFFVG